MTREKNTNIIQIIKFCVAKSQQIGWRVDMFYKVVTYESQIHFLLREAEVIIKFNYKVKPISHGLKRN